MSEQTTPETDAATHDLSDYGSPVLCSWGDWVDADFARKLERERDEARKAFVIATDQMVIAQSNLREANKERDEAREALMKIEDLFIDGTDIYADRETMGTIARNELEGAN